MSYGIEYKPSEGGVIEIKLPAVIDTPALRQALTSAVINVLTSLEPATNFPSSVAEFKSTCNLLFQATSFKEVKQILQRSTPFINPDLITGNELRKQFKTIRLLKSLILNERVYVQNHTNYGYNTQYDAWIRLVKTDEIYTVAIMKGSNSNSRFPKFEIYENIPFDNFVKLIIQLKQQGNLELLINRLCDRNDLIYIFQTTNNMSEGLEIIGWNRSCSIKE